MLNGKTKQVAKKTLYKILGNRFNGFFSDQYWYPVNRFFSDLNNVNINWNTYNCYYQADKNQVLTHKVWQLEFNFEDNKGKQQTLCGEITAAGAGSVKDPLDKYDLNFTVS